ncbi:MAG: cation:proton antiporter [Anaerolineae bacterium]
MLASLLLILGLGLLACRLSERLRLPVLVGLMPLGLGLGPYGLDVLSPQMLSLSGDICTVALILILLQAGISLDLGTLRGSRAAALRLGLVPFLLEAAVISAVARLALRMPALEAAMAGTILAAAAPAIIVPAMLELQARGIGAEHHIPALVVAANALENVVAVTLIGALSSAGAAPFQTVWPHLALVPLVLLGGLALGIAGGHLLGLALASDALPRPVQKLCLVLSAALGIALGGQALGVAGYAGVMGLGITLSQRAPREASEMLRVLDPVWYVVQIFLFTLIGAQIDPAMMLRVGAIGAGLIATGLVARMLGAWIALAGTRLHPPERAFCAIALTPNATVQAAIEGVPLAMGLASGPPILALAILAIVMAGPLGALATSALAPRWLSATAPDDIASPGPGVLSTQATALKS